MKFTLVFASGESDDISVGGIFIPCFAWRINGRNYIPHRDDPHYRPGDFDYLLRLLKVGKQSRVESNKVIIVVHPNGHGCEDDLLALADDVRSMGYGVYRSGFEVEL
jgi:hypothetical protein